MTTIISVIKIIIFLFPFIKEIFVSEGREDYDRRKVVKKLSITKKIIIILICLSLIFNYYLVVKVYDLGRKNLALQKQIKEKTDNPVTYPKKNEIIIEECEKEQTTKYKSNNKSSLKNSPSNHKTPNNVNDLINDLEEINKIR